MLPNGVAGVVLGHVGGSSVSASLGLGINTTPGPVHTKVIVNGVEIAIDLDTTGFTFLIQDVDINLGGLFEIRGDFRLSSGAFSGSGLEIFIGSGPSMIDGALNPNAIGVLITNATISYQSFGASAGDGLYAIYVTGTVRLLGLPGLVVTGTATFMVNTTGVARRPAGAPADIAANTFSFIGSLSFEVAGVFKIGGTVGISRRPAGDLDLMFSGATISVISGSQTLFSISGNAAFTISPGTGLRLTTFQVTGFSLMGQGGGNPPGPNAAGAARAGAAADRRRRAHRGRRSRPRSSTPARSTSSSTTAAAPASRPSSILDSGQEFELEINGIAMTVTGIPVAVAGKPNTYRYSFTGDVPATGLVTVRFLGGSFSDNSTHRPA